MEAKRTKVHETFCFLTLCALITAILMANNRVLFIFLQIYDDKWPTFEVETPDIIIIIVDHIISHRTHTQIVRQRHKSQLKIIMRPAVRTAKVIAAPAQAAVVVVAVVRIPTVQVIQTHQTEVRAHK